MASKHNVPLHTAPSWESCDSHVIFDQGPPSRKRKATQTDCSVFSFLKRYCDSPLDDGTSSGGTQTEQAWESPVKDIDLIASDCLEDDIDLDAADEECKACLPNTRSEDWSFLSEASKPLRQPSLELASPEPETINFSQSPTKSGDFVPKELPQRCFVARTASQYGFTPLAISVGTSYFQRLAAADPELKEAALDCPDFAPFVAGIPDLPARRKPSVGAPLHQCQGPRRWLLAIHLTCIYIAAKNVEVVPYRHLLRTMLERIHNLIVRPEQAEQLEVEVLVALDWRLGPFFLNCEEEEA